MSKRYDRLLQHPFFENRPGLAEQLTQYEKKTGNFLPNEFHHNEISPEATKTAESIIKIGRFHQFYYFQHVHETKGTTTLFYPDESSLMAFLSTHTKELHLPETKEKEWLVFWRLKLKSLNQKAVPA